MVGRMGPIVLLVAVCLSVRKRCLFNELRIAPPPLPLRFGRKRVNDPSLNRRMAADVCWRHACLCFIFFGSGGCCKKTFLSESSGLLCPPPPPAP